MQQTEPIVAPLLSIVIPTRNRFDYVKSSIKATLAIQSQLVQVVVEDNSDSRELQNWIRDNIDDARLAYRHTDGYRSMVENYNQAVSRASGKYISLIGDDDAVGPEIIEATHWASETGLDALTPTTPAHYVWPDLALPGSLAVKAGELRIAPFTGRTSFPNGLTELRACLHDAGQNFHQLPKAYYGIVRAKCLEAVKERTGSYFPGVSPDMAAAASLALVVDKLCWIDYPLFLPGSSARSNAGLSGLGKHIGRLKDQRHLPPNVEDLWSEVVPKFYSVETMWGESLVGALTAMGRADLLRFFNLSRLASECLMWHPEYRSQVTSRFFPALRRIGQSPLLGAAGLGCHLLRLTGLRARSLLTRVFKGQPQREDWLAATSLQDIHSAVEEFANFLSMRTTSQTPIPPWRR